jgi:hypothetical protein
MPLPPPPTAIPAAPRPDELDAAQRVRESLRLRRDEVAQLAGKYRATAATTRATLANQEFQAAVLDGEAAELDRLLAWLDAAPAAPCALCRGDGCTFCGRPAD